MQMQKQANFYSIPECYVYIGQSAQQRGVLAAAAAFVCPLGFGSVAK